MKVHQMPLSSLGFYRLAALGLISVSLLSLSACGPRPDEKKGPDGKPIAAVAPPTPFAAIANGKVDIEGGVIAVAARRAGIISEVLVKEGDIVKKGAVLARLEVEDTILAVNSARASVEQAQAASGLTRVQLQAAQREYDRLATLAPQNFVAQSKLDQARDQIRQAEAQLVNEHAAVSSARARLAEAQYNVEQTFIRAPANGKIVRSYANPGAGASTLNVTSMFTLEPEAPRIVRAEIIESAIPSVSVGQDVEIIPEAEQTKVFVGKVLRISPMFGARKLNSDDGNQAADERVVEVVVSADGTPFLIGQRVLVKFMKPGEVAGAKREAPKPVDDKNKK
jgi:HlyD family secretion protein